MTDTQIGFADKLKGAMTIAERVKVAVIRHAQDYEAIGRDVSEIRDLEKELEAEYKAHPVILQAKEIQKKKGEIAELLEAARKGGKSKMIAFEDDERARRQAEEAKLAAEAKQKADAEAMEAAELAEKSGDREQAQAIIEAAASAPAPVVVIERAVPKVAGHKRRTLVKFCFVDARGNEVNEKQAGQLGLVPSKYWTPDRSKVKGDVDALGTAAKIPGVRVWEEVV